MHTPRTWLTLFSLTNHIEDRTPKHKTVCNLHMAEVMEVVVDLRTSVVLKVLISAIGVADVLPVCTHSNKFPS